MADDAGVSEIQGGERIVSIEVVSGLLGGSVAIAVGCPWPAMPGADPVIEEDGKQREVPEPFQVVKIQLLFGDPKRGIPACYQILGYANPDTEQNKAQLAIRKTVAVDKVLQVNYVGPVAVMDAQFADEDEPDDADDEELDE